MVIAGAYLLWGPAAWVAGWLMRGRGGAREDLDAASAEEVVDGAPNR
jgi:hypothetical protein